MAERELSPEVGSPRRDDAVETARTTTMRRTPLHRLQGSAGNQAVCRLIQARQPPSRTGPAPAERADSLTVQRGRTKGKKRKAASEFDDFIDDGDDEELDDEDDYDVNLEPPEPYESLEFDGVEPLWQRPGWSPRVKAWVKAELQGRPVCPCGQVIKPKLIKAYGQRAKKRRKTGQGGMRVNYDIDHHTIRWADRRDAMQDLKRQGEVITKPVVRRVHESKLRLMHSACNLSHAYEPRRPPPFDLDDHDGNPAG